MCTSLFVKLIGGKYAFKEGRGSLVGGPVTHLNKPFK